jgi:hypothetical protein
MNCSQCSRSDWSSGNRITLSLSSVFPVFLVFLVCVHMQEHGHRYIPKGDTKPIRGTGNREHFQPRMA